MRIFQDVAGYSLGMADIIRRLMSEKDTAQMAKEKVVFLYGDEKRKVDGALKRGVTPAAAERLWEKIADFAEYAFNKSHATAYAYLSYQTAYLCVYHRIEFMAAILNNRISHIEEISNYLSYLKDCKIDVLPPDINKSGRDFSALSSAVRVGLGAVKNVGTKAIEQIIEERKNGDFKDFEDFLNRSEGLNRKMLESLILAGAFDCFKKPRACLFSISEHALEIVTSAKKQRISGQMSLFDILADQGAALARIQYPRIAEYDESVRLKLEKEVLGVYISGHPLRRYESALSALSHNSLMLTASQEGEDGVTIYENAEDRMRVQLGGILSDVRKRINKRTGAESKTGKLEDLYGIIEVNLSEKMYSQYKDMFVDDSVIQLEGSLSLREGERPSVWINRMLPLNGAREQSGNLATIYIRMDLSDEILNDKLMSILANYPGRAGVRVQDTVSKAVYPVDVRVHASETLRKELVGLCGYDNVKVVGNLTD